jgi:CheY-like chemotaxis protein
MPVPFRVALLGFSDFERSTLSSYFRLAARRNPSYELVQLLLEPDFMVADADHGPSVQLVLASERLGQTVFIGSEAPPGASAWMQRPIDPLHVMRELDAMVAQNRPAAEPAQPPAAVAPAAPAATVAGQRTAIQAARRSRRPVATPKAPPAPPAPLAVPAAPASEPEGRPAPIPAAAEDSPLLTLRGVAPVARAAAAPPPVVQRGEPPTPVLPPPAAKPRANTLVVDDSELARHFLARQLEPWGLRCDFADGSKRALQMLARQAYEFVFLDIELGEGSELDGLALCQRIKRQLAPTPGVLATVVLVSAHHSELDRVRGSLAGCDAFLAKPLVPADLQRLLRRHGLALPAPSSSGA